MSGSGAGDGDNDTPGSGKAGSKASLIASVPRGLRRSSRVRDKWLQGFTSSEHILWGSQNSGTSDAKSYSSLESTGSGRLDQRAPLYPAEIGQPALPFDVKIHPCASALIEFHSHLAKTEIIGYLAGQVVNLNKGNDTSSPSTTLYILEAFPARCVEPRILARTGRNALREVEMDPESDVEVRLRIAAKGLMIVGWYHSHPYFSADPSEVDIENQLNYQNLLFQESPSVAVICSPYWDELEDCRAHLEMFYVHAPSREPLKVPHSTTTGYPPPVSDEKGVIPSAYEVSHLSNSSPARGDQLASLENEAMHLISHYCTFPRRVDLHAEWREGCTILEKLRGSLQKLCEGKIRCARTMDKDVENVNSTERQASQGPETKLADESKSQLPTGRGQENRENIVVQQPPSPREDDDIGSDMMHASGPTALQEFLGDLASVLMRIVDIAGETWQSTRKDQDSRSEVLRNKRVKKRKRKN